MGKEEENDERKVVFWCLQDGGYRVFVKVTFLSFDFSQATLHQFFSHSSLGDSHTL